jgi:hypothetical protein
MGTDATAIVEIELAGTWMPALMPIWPNPSYDPKSEDEDERQEYTLYPHIVREYSLFSVLADVRNRTGRGTTTMRKSVLPDGTTIEHPYDTDDGGHQTLKYIDVPRGIPDDATEPWKELFGQEGFHDHTWLTLQELIDGPWQQEVLVDGILLEDDYLAYMRDGKQPGYTAHGAGGTGLAIVSEQEYLEGKRGETSTAVHAKWQGGTVQHRNHYFGLYLRIMMMLAPEDDYTKVRLMVAFDS